MIVFLNPASCGGTGMSRWKAIEPTLRARSASIRAIVPNDRNEFPGLVRLEYGKGEREFVAAGGDGTVNALVNGLVTGLTDEERRTVALGAIGLGSSNDFHKPFSKSPGGVPMKLDFHRATNRDVGIVECIDGGAKEQRYFLINASVGLTAEANLYFNTPDPFLSFLKKKHPSSAIAWSALGTILSYRNRRFTVLRDDGPGRDVFLTNLNILKSPHVSGTLTYPGAPAYDSGLVSCFLATSMGLADRLLLLSALSRGGVPVTGKLESFTASHLTISSDGPFAVELDGEIIQTSDATFSVITKYLRVCPC
jgi:diacylglycerol kinase (ATP)